MPSDISTQKRKSLGDWSQAGRALLLIALVGLTVVVGCYRDSESRLVEIRTLQDSGEFEASIEPIRVLLHTDPTQPEANFRLGLALVQTGRTGLAVWPLQKASQTTEYGVQAGLVLARLLYNAKDYEEAARTAEQVLANDPERAAAIEIHAKAKIGASDPEAALTDANRLLEMSPDNLEAFLIRAAALIDLDRSEEAEQTHRDMLAAARESGNTDREARACALLAAHLASDLKTSEAEAQYIECLGEYPAHPLVMQYATTFYRDHNRPDDAIALWRRAVNDVPENFGLRSSLATLLVQQDRAAEAETVLQESVEVFDTAGAWQTLSAFYKNLGNTSAARKALEMAIDRAPGHSESLQFALADLLITEGELERASEIAESIKEPAYRNMLRGGIRLQQNNPKGALEIFEAGLRLWPNNAGARYLAGSAAEQMGDLKRASAEYREALRVDSQATDAALRLAVLHFALGEFENAQQFAARQIEERPQSAGPEAYILRIRAASAMGNHEEALRRLNELERSDIAPLEVLVERAAVVRESEGPKAAAAVVLESDVDLSQPESFLVLRSLVQDLTATGRGNEALKQLQPVLAAQPENADIYDLKGRVQLQLGQPGAAGESLDRALELEPEHARALHAQASIAAAANNLEQAFDFATRSAGATEAVNEKAAPLYTAAQIAMLLGRRADAIALFGETVRVQPGHVGAANNLAWELAETGGSLDRALELAQRASSVSPSSTTLDTLGWVQLKRGSVKEATRSFEAALEENPGSPTIRYHLALALAKQGETERAKQLLQESLANADFSEREKAEVELARLEDR